MNAELVSAVVAEQRTAPRQPFANRPATFEAAEIGPGPEHRHRLCVVLALRRSCAPKCRSAGRTPHCGEPIAAVKYAGAHYPVEYPRRTLRPPRGYLLEEATS